jgi:hypothetical protein
MNVDFTQEGGHGVLSFNNTVILSEVEGPLMLDTARGLERRFYHGAMRNLSETLKL